MDNPNQDDKITMVTVDSFLSVQDATMARLKLEQEGIPCWLDNEHIVSTNPMLGPATGGIKLNVRSDHARRAAHVLQPELPQKCPKCKSEEIRLKPLSKKLVIFSLLLLTLPLWLLPRFWQCNKCGHE